jgi:4-hydroxy-3-polyprenylbenzoate decarboxylase
MRDAWNQLPVFRQVLAMAPKVVSRGECQQNIIERDDVDLSMLPIQTCWPDDAARW